MGCIVAAGRKWSTWGLFSGLLGTRWTGGTADGVRRCTGQPSRIRTPPRDAGRGLADGGRLASDSDAGPGAFWASDDSRRRAGLLGGLEGP